MWICEKKEFWVRSNGRWERSDTIATAACSVDGKSKATDNQLFRRLPTYLSLERTNCNRKRHRHHHLEGSNKNDCSLGLRRAHCLLPFISLDEHQIMYKPSQRSAKLSHRWQILSIPIEWRLQTRPNHKSKI